MTIDEHIKYIQSTIEWAKAFGGEDDDGLIIYWTEQLEMLEELNWFRKQDLIRREDVFKLCSCSYYYAGSRENCSEADECEKCQYYDAVYMDLFKIPKAEPPIGECTPNCEKSITCKHCIQGTYCNSSTGKEEESPCCWESKEEGWRNAF